MFGRRKKANRPDPTVDATVDLDVLIASLGQNIEFWRFQPEPKLLTRAVFADYCRDCSLEPVSETDFSKSWSQFDEAGQQRFGLVLSAFKMDAPRARLKQMGKSQLGLDQLAKLATNHKQLTLDVIEQSDIRLEELARHFCAGWELPIRDESAQASAKRLNDIDFDRLMREADTAKSSAQERMDYLRKLQEEQEETRRPRRGKW